MPRKPTKASNGPKTIGPVSDLERHLPSDWWQSLFNSLYLKTDGDVVENDNNTAREIDLLVQSAGLERNDRILDLCCGQGRHAIELSRRGFQHVTGIDRSRYLIRLARRRARGLGLPVTWHEGDARRFRLAPQSFHCVALMGNSFGYFDREEDDVAVLQAVKRALRPGGTLAMDLADGEHMRANFERRSWEWIDENHFVCRERSLARDGRRLITREVVVHAEKGVLADQFYAERLYNRPQIEALLAQVGFESVRFHTQIEAESERNQDLGMMASRMFLTVQAPRTTLALPRIGNAFPEITVLMGDPRLPDGVKLDGQFNPEDFETINRLKDALNELEGYRFTYLDNHASLLAELRSNPPKFVMNLCDEGFNNDAGQELHVPAYLEMLGVPYTGAGPGCLALCYNKSLVRALAMALEIPVPLETFSDPDDQSATIPSVYPALIKPNTGDSSLGITAQAVVHSAEEAVTYISRLRDTLPGRALLIQEFLTGPEYSLSLVGNPGIGFTALPVLEVDYSRLPTHLPRILGYESKWDPDSPYWTEIKYQEARLDDDRKRRLIDYATVLFERLGCVDYARFDFRADAAGEIKLLEVNPNPGWCWDGKVNLMAGMGGLRYADLLRMILDVAQARLAARARPLAELPASRAA